MRPKLGEQSSDLAAIVPGKGVEGRGKVALHAKRAYVQGLGYVREVRRPLDSMTNSSTSRVSWEAWASRRRTRVLSSFRLLTMRKAMDVDMKS